MFVFDKIKHYLIVAFIVAKAALLAFVSLRSYQAGKNASEVDRLEQANKNHKRIADFHREMSEHEQEIRNSKLHDRNNLVDRLRDKGL